MNAVRAGLWERWWDNMIHLIGGKNERNLPNYRNDYGVWVFRDRT